MQIDGVFRKADFSKETELKQELAPQFSGSRRKMDFQTLLLQEEKEAKKGFSSQVGGYGRELSLRRRDHGAEAQSGKGDTRQRGR